MTSGRFVLGDEVEAFEAEFASYCGVRHAVGVGNGLDALTIALRASDVGHGDEVVVPAHTFIATWLAVERVGARVVPVDVDADTLLIDLDAAAAAVTSRTAAIVPVHLYGRAADMTALSRSSPHASVYCCSATPHRRTARAGGIATSLRLATRPRSRSIRRRTSAPSVTAAR